jgi:glycosyltransferase involved in cell wall biosynthesis
MKELIYIIEGANWSTDWDGKNIVRNLKEISGKTDTSAHQYQNSLIHLGCLPLFFAKNDTSVMETMHPSNKVILTIFHLSSDYISKLTKLTSSLAQVDLFHTSCQITKEQLIRLGLPAEKIVVIPLGVDLKIFTPTHLEEKKRLRQELGIPENKIIIGSFQKDGVGWEEGNEPKLIKGPDIFLPSRRKFSQKTCYPGTVDRSS